ncbi:DUF397 domain-containing protein [Nocardiopsis sediminis]|uniref:DUF397 domain-containing protein n=1 Tax=Nocardiopsis sediminis TaxID=1778267 RepID=A0ABV8FW51_9ACTN
MLAHSTDSPNTRKNCGSAEIPFLGYQRGWMMEPVWHKSSFSKVGGECVEVAATPASVFVRDTKFPAEVVLGVAPVEFVAFVRVVRSDAL